MLSWRLLLLMLFVVLIPLASKKTSASEIDLGGISLAIAYTAESFGKLNGSLDNGGTFHSLGHFEMAASADLERIGMWRGGRIYFLGQALRGRGVTANGVGDFQTVSNLEAPAFTQLSEYWFEQFLAGERLRIKAGKQDANADFCALDNGEFFINSSFGIIPTVPIPTFPTPGLGMAAFALLSPWLEFGAGYYDAAPDGSTLGFDTAFDGVDGGVGIVQVAVQSRLGTKGALTGHWRFGVWHHAAGYEEIAPKGEVRLYGFNYGLYLACDQLLLKKESRFDTERGLGLFVQAGWTPGDRSELSRYLGGGFAWYGPLASRAHDVLGIGVATAGFSTRLRRLQSLRDEMALEMFYRIEMTSWFAAQPDLQYIVAPSGEGENATVLGLRIEMTLP